MQIDWTQVILGIIGILVSSLLIPIVKSKLSTDKLTKLDQIMRYLIAAAEIEIEGVKMGQARQDWVIAELRKLKLVNDSNEAQVRIWINGLVEELTGAFVINREKMATIATVETDVSIEQLQELTDRLNAATEAIHKMEPIEELPTIKKTTKKKVNKKAEVIEDGTD